LRLNRPNGIQSIIPCDIHLLKDPPKLGTVLTVKHHGHYQNGILKHAYIWRERNDLSWKDVEQSRQMVYYHFFFTIIILNYY
jgi:hypothetical protein